MDDSTYKNQIFMFSHEQLVNAFSEFNKVYDEQKDTLEQANILIEFLNNQIKEIEE